MLNHLRCLLLNRPGSATVPAGLPGEELVDPSYRAVPLPAYLQRVRQLLFGQHPDRAMLNYRVNQLVRILHDSELAPYVTSFDPRISYLPFQDRSAYDRDFGAVASQRAGSGVLYFSGSADALGESLWYEWRVAVEGSVVRLSRDTAPLAEELHGLVLTDQLSQDLTLPGSQLKINIGRPADGDQWAVTGYLRPPLDLGVAVARVAAAAGSSLTNLFGTPADAEPLPTCRALWYDRVEFPYRAAALALALAVRTDAVRVQ